MKTEPKYTKDDLLNMLIDEARLCRRELSRNEVEAIAFDAEASDETSLQYRNILLLADKMISGEDKAFPGQAIPPHRILFVLNKSGLEIVID